MRHTNRTSSRISSAVLACAFILFIVFSVPAFAGDKYRTFSQDDLSVKKAKAGKTFASQVSFRFYNLTGGSVDGLDLKLNATIISIPDSGGFTTFAFSKKNVMISGRTITPGDSATFTFITSKKSPGTKVSSWHWDSSGVQKGPKNGPLFAMADSGLPIQPNGGNVLEYLYKKVIVRPAGVVIGLESDTPGVHWIRYLKADRKYFPHTGTPGCFDFVLRKHELKNPHVEKFNNHLLGEVHALRLAIIANDYGVTEPDTPANRLGDLLYTVPGDPLDGMTIRGIVYLADSALTYCAHTFTTTYGHLDTVVSQINLAFGGPYTAVSFTPFVLAGTQDVSIIPFLHTNPNAQPVAVHRPMYSVVDPDPQTFTLYQNYPNPFNPTTTIQFALPQQALVTLKIYNILGQEVATLLDNQMMDSGEQQVEFDGAGLSSGLYIYRINAGSFTETRKMMLMK